MRRYFNLSWMICLISLPLYALCADSTHTDYYGPVQAKDTLWSIANRLRPAGIGTKQMVIALQQTNPQAFVGGNFNKLTVGDSLRIPNLTEIRQISATQASELFSQQLANPSAPNLPDLINPIHNPLPVQPLNPPVISAPISQPTSKPTSVVSLTTKPAKPLPIEQPTISQSFYLMGIVLIIGVIGIVGYLWRRFWRETDYPAELIIPVTRPQAFLNGPMPAQPISEPQANTDYADATPSSEALTSKPQPATPPMDDIASLNSTDGLDQPLDDLEAAFAVLSEDKQDLASNDTLSASPMSCDPVDDHIALASAYYDLGDTKSARELLTEVQHIGNPDQQQQAADLLKHLPT